MISLDSIITLLGKIVWVADDFRQTCGICVLRLRMFQKIPLTPAKFVHYLQFTPLTQVPGMLEVCLIPKLHWPSCSLLGNHIFVQNYVLVWVPYGARDAWRRF